MALATSGCGPRGMRKAPAIGGWEDHVARVSDPPVTGSAEARYPGKYADWWRRVEPRNIFMFSFRDGSAARSGGSIAFYEKQVSPSLFKNNTTPSSNKGFNTRKTCEIGP